MKRLKPLPPARTPASNGVRPRAQRHKPETVWRLVQGLCDQLADAVNAARIPFFLAMAWAFLWAAVLYDFQWGYTNELVDRYRMMEHDSAELRRLYLVRNGAPLLKVQTAKSAAPPSSAPSASVSLVESSAVGVPPTPLDLLKASTAASSIVPWTEPVPIDRANKKWTTFVKQCECNLAGDVAQALMGEDDRPACPALTDKKGWMPPLSVPEQGQPRLLQACFARLDATLARNEASQHENRFVQFPGLPIKLHTSELSNIGQAGTLLLYIWMYYAFRRENHAIRQFVDFSHRRAIKRFNQFKRFIYVMRLDTYVLEPQNDLFQSESLAYGYGAIAQRFLLILTREGNPLRISTILLLGFPWVVVALNLGTDLSDDWYHFNLFPLEKASMALYDGTAVALFAWLTIVTMKVIAELMESSVLLYGWYLASRDVWHPEWDESQDTSPSAAVIDVKGMKAKRHD